jgi:hypothetical protein
MTRDEIDWRNVAGYLGFYGGIVGSVLVITAVTTIFGPAKNSALDRFVVQHIAVFQGVFCAVFFGSLITLPSSFCGQGMKRGIGVVLGLMNILFSLGILGAGE